MSFEQSMGEGSKQVQADGMDGIGEARLDIFSLFPPLPICPSRHRLVDSHAVLH